MPKIYSIAKSFFIKELNYHQYIKNILVFYSSFWLKLIRFYLIIRY